eukprot:TRINITY_DN7252_c0_g1_i1.p1 TRINITY_DN7252_c0_g1~~TRINITY_DN7252_c0_g1_i1.p1  ORF type:complete len:515 (-),score=65.66 TRINITY_DN7252_c0_g1_i1:252-1796(-)
MDSSCTCAAETMYVEGMSSMERTGGLSSLVAKNMDTLPRVPNTLLKQVGVIQGGCDEFISRIQYRLDMMRNTLVQGECFEELSIIREIPSEVISLFRSRIELVVQATMDEVQAMSDVMCDHVCQRQGSLAGTNARALASKSIDALPSTIRSKFDAFLAEAHVAMSGHVELIASGLQSAYISQKGFIDVELNVSAEVQHILWAKVAAAAQECYEDGRRKIEGALNSFDIPQSLPSAEVVQADRNDLTGAVGQALEKEELEESAFALAYEAEASNMLQSSLSVSAGELAVSEGLRQETHVAIDGELHSALPVVPQGDVRPADLNTSLPISSPQHIIQDSNRMLMASSIAPDMVSDADDLDHLRGSMGHPELCSRPCVFAASGQCELGVSCNFCHMPHERAAVHLDKKRRDALKRMTYQERVATILPLVRMKIVELQLDEGLLQNISDILGTMELLTCTSDVLSSMRKIQRAQVTRFTIRSLFSMMKQGESQATPSQLQVSVARLLRDIKADVVRLS